MAMQQRNRKHSSARDISPALIQALDHPVRRQVLRMFTKRKPEWSPVELAKLVRVGLSHVSYHTRVLSDLDVIKESRTEPVRGSTQHFYTSTVTDNRLARKILAETKADDEESLEGANERKERNA